MASARPVVRRVGVASRRRASHRRSAERRPTSRWCCPRGGFCAGRAPPDSCPCRRARERSRRPARASISVISQPTVFTCACSRARSRVDKGRCRWLGRWTRSIGSSTRSSWCLCSWARRASRWARGSARSWPAPPSRRSRASPGEPRSSPRTPIPPSAWRCAAATSSLGSRQLQHDSRRTGALGRGAAPARGRRKPRASDSDREPAREHPDTRARRPPSAPRARGSAHRRGVRARRADRSGGGHRGAGTRRQAGRADRRRAHRPDRRGGGGARQRPGPQSGELRGERRADAGSRAAAAHPASAVQPGRQRAQVEPGRRH